MTDADWIGWSLCTLAGLVLAVGIYFVTRTS